MDCCFAAPGTAPVYRQTLLCCCCSGATHPRVSLTCCCWCYSGCCFITAVLLLLYIHAAFVRMFFNTCHVYQDTAVVLFTQSVVITVVDTCHGHVLLVLQVVQIFRREGLYRTNQNPRLTQKQCIPLMFTHRTWF